MNKVIVDTSAWIEYFRPQGDAELKEAIKPLISEVRALLPGIIRTEILRGARSRKEYEMLNDLLRGLTHLPVTEDFWGRLSRFSFNLFRKGIAVPLTDTYIALVAIENNAHLLHRDKHFDLIAQETGLEILKV
ncbi:PIN domain nuclease [Dehalococcoidia bacterium]|nr:PIN domain nuclease [Dehalococcoidia bacterium]